MQTKAGLAFLYALWGLFLLLNFTPDLHGDQEGNHFAWQNGHSCFNTGTLKMTLLSYEPQLV